MPGGRPREPGRPAKSRLPVRHGAQGPAGHRTSSLGIAGTYIGTVIGAGFASGQEVYQFFGHFGMWGALGIALAATLFAWFGFVIVETGRRLGSSSHSSLVENVAGRLSPSLDAAITFFLFGGVVAMLSGAGAVAFEQFGIPRFAGSVLMAGVSTLTVMFGLRGIVVAISAFVPFILVTVVFVSAVTLAASGLDGRALAFADPETAPVSTWLGSALIYVSYNLLTASAVLAPLGPTAGTRRRVACGVLLGGAGLGIAAMAIHLAILSLLPASAARDIPMAYVVARLGPVIRAAYTVVLLAEIYSTAVADLFGFAARFCRPQSRGFTVVVILTGGFALIGARLGFTAVVRTVYPAAGYAGVLLLTCLLLRAPALLRRG